MMQIRYILMEFSRLQKEPWQSFSHEPLEVMVRKRLSEMDVNISTLTAVVWQGEGLAHGGQPPAAEHCVQHSTVRSAMTSINSAKR